MRKLLYILLLFPLFVHAQSIHITAPADTICNGIPVTFTATGTGVLVPYYQWTVNGLTIVGADSSTFVRDSFSNGDSVVCLLTDNTHSSVIAYSNSVIISVVSFPFAGTITGPDSVVCIGATIVLSDSVAGGVWSASNDNATDTNDIVTGVRMVEGFDGYLRTKDSIYYIINNICGSDTAFKVVEIQTKPSAGFYLGNSFPYGQNIICVGGSLPIYSGDDGDPGAEGTMYSSNSHVSLSWESVYGVSAGTDYLFCVNGNVCGSDTFGLNVIVYDTPTVGPILASSTHVCAGATIQLADSLTGYPSWSASNINASIDSRYGIVTGTSSGLDTIILRSSNTCSQKSASIVIAIDPPMPVIGIDSFCAGEEVRFFDSTAGGIWSSSDSFIVAVDGGGTLRGLSEGGALISYTLPVTGCVSMRVANVYQNFLPNPITGDGDFCLSGTAKLSEATEGGRWSSSNTQIASVDVTGGIYGISDGVATITYSLKGCLETKDVSVSTCKDEMNIYPNPAHDEVTIYAFDNIYNTYSFVNAIGQKVMQGTLIGPFTKVDVALLAAGFYTVVITGEQDKYVGKFVKE